MFISFFFLFLLLLLALLLAEHHWEIDFLVCKQNYRVFSNFYFLFSLSLFLLLSQALPLLNAAAARGLAKIWSNLGLALADSRQSSRRNKGSATLSEDTAAGDNIGAGCEQKWKHESTAAPPSASETASKKRVGAWAARLRLVFWCVLALGPLVASCLATTVLACAAQANYPGGEQS